MKKKKRVKYWTPRIKEETLRFKKSATWKMVKSSTPKIKGQILKYIMSRNGAYPKSTIKQISVHYPRQQNKLKSTMCPNGWSLTHVMWKEEETDQWQQIRKETTQENKNHRNKVNKWYFPRKKGLKAFPRSPKPARGLKHKRLLIQLQKS